jgi:O-methyltransferase
MDNTFILQFQDNSERTTRTERLMSRLIKFINSHNSLVKLKFKEDRLNRLFGIKYSPLFDTKENMLKGIMANTEQAVNIYHLLVQTILLKIPGEVVELGCFEGTTSIIMQKTLDQFECPKNIHVYDSFEGIPTPSSNDGGTDFVEGQCKTSKSNLIDNYKKYGVKLPQIHEGWFKNTLPQELPDQISFAHLDGDLYSSIKESLIAIYPRLAKGAIVVIDDYCDPQTHNVNNILPGVRVACEEFFADKPEKVGILLAGGETHGYFRKE